MITGFTVGKFYPPHRGHKHLIDSARRQVDRLIVMLCHHASQLIPGELRKAWLEEIHPDCEIHLVPDELENDSQQWAAFTLRHLGFKPDIVFTSEEYGHRFAELMGSRHVLVDQQRLAVRISATQIRQSPLDHLDWLEPCVRAYFVKRVVLIGAESTGKTTLAERLAGHYRTHWVAEYGREHWEKKVAGLTMSDPLPHWTADEFVHIATEQQRRENLAARSANRVLFCDTNAFITGTWFERYMQTRSREVDQIGSMDKADLYLLTEPDFGFVQDGF
jgi:NadR type nicotinamide-nucleotide adenylyltransferase